MSSETLALIAIIVAAASECIALNPKLRSNSVIQLVLAGLKLCIPQEKMTLPEEQIRGDHPSQERRTSLSGPMKASQPWFE